MFNTATGPRTEFNANCIMKGLGISSLYPFDRYAFTLKASHERKEKNPGAFLVVWPYETNIIFAIKTKMEVHRAYLTLASSF